MHCVNLACLFACVLCVTATRQPLRVDVKPADRQKRSPADVAMVTPVRVEDDLSAVVTSQHYRKRRSVSSSNVDLDEFRNPTYKINAFGDDMYVRLVPDQVLVAPAFTTTFAWRNVTIHQKDSSNQPILRRCFYKGTVVGQPGSQVALSICDSLTGSIYTNDYQYTITPVDKATSSDGTVRHRIERRSVGDKSAFHKHGAQCGVRDARHRRQYSKTFFKSPIEDASQKIAAQMERSRRSAEPSLSGQSILELENMSEGEAKSRRKRDFESHQHYIETLVVADASMVREHGDDLEHYIMTVMMVANRVFTHPSLGSAVALSVVKIIVIEDEADGPRVTSSAANTLRQFCSWQKRVNILDESDPEHADLAILLTRTDLCGESCDTLGMAEVGTMCSSLHSCAIVEDDGLSAAYTVAHEVGHVLNMMHDDNRLCRANFVNIDSRSHVMSSTMDRVDSEQPWSLCSRQAVLDFLQEGRGDCLLDAPSQPKAYPSKLPGAIYDVNAQCEMAFGEGAVECPYMVECGRLWCRLPSGTNSNQCHTRSFPRADGSPCADGMHCMQGQCLPKRDRPQPVNGQWGKWSDFGTCSRSCDSGVQMASRECNSPAPKNGGKYCTGDRLRFRSCSAEKCPMVNGQQPRDFRSEQCATYNGQQIPLLGARSTYTWIPKYADVHVRDRCKLICQSVQTGAYITFADRVIDGTRCGPDTTDVCVHGQCMPAGCDGVLGSMAKYNKCGVCKGRKSSCKRVRGKYNKRLPGYNDVVVLPVGAANIKITQRGFRNNVHDGNYLAMTDSHGRYLLNGALTLSTIKKDIELNGTVLQYSGVSVSTEKIHTTMPLKAPVTVQILSLGLHGTDILPPRIKYSYHVSVPHVETEQDRMIDSDGGPVLISRSSLKPEPRKPASRRLLPRWVSGRWRKCKAYGKSKCGSGWKRRAVTCKIGKRRTSGCDATKKPYSRLPCFISDCPTIAPVRRVPNRRTHGGPTLINRFVNHNERPLWKAGRWGPCSASCGLGTKLRQVTCQTRSSRFVSDDMCDAGRRPSEAHGCRLRDCP